MERKKNNTRIDYNKRKKVTKRKKPANLSYLKMRQDASRKILQKKKRTKKNSKNKKRV